MNVEGFAEDGYDAVRQVFQRLVDSGLETGAGVSVWREGREVVRLNAGWVDAGRSRPWRGDTLVQPYSLSKSFVTLAALVAVRQVLERVRGPGQGANHPPPRAHTPGGSAALRTRSRRS